MEKEKEVDGRDNKKRPSAKNYEKKKDHLFLSSEVRKGVI